MRRTVMAVAVVLGLGGIARAQDLPAYDPPPDLSGGMTWAGSDTERELLDAWGRAFEQLHPDVEVAGENEGSATAPPALVEGRATLGAMSRPMTDGEAALFEETKGRAPTPVTIALDALAVFANDAIQTLGTFLSSNSHRPWWILWLYACSILVAVLVYGWWANYGDVAYGRLEKFPEPADGITWIHAIPPIFIVLLTRYGIPVSTTFLILTVSAPTNMQAILIKSVMGYGVAFVVGIAVYFAVARLIESRFISTHSPGRNPGWYWVVLQWASTGFLWS